VETAWQLRITRTALAVDVDGESLVISRNGKRSNLTSCRDALNGYQKGKCFYCFSDISVENTSERLADVDHFHPRLLVQLDVPLKLDGVWNLVLSCRECNRGIDGKSSRLPHRRFLERLDTRTGEIRQERVRFLNLAYGTAWEWLIHTWEPSFEHEPAF
jgi:5-methylcytosine-specific restriction endonuclease McrA